MWTQAGSETRTPPKLRLGDDARPSADAVEFWVLLDMEGYCPTRARARSSHWRVGAWSG